MADNSVLNKIKGTYRVGKVTPEQIAEATKEFEQSKTIPTIWHGVKQFLDAPLIFLDHATAYDDLNKSLGDYYPMPRTDRSARDKAANYAGGYDYGQRAASTQPIEGVINAAKASQMLDYIKDDSRRNDAVMDYLENKAGIEQAYADYNERRDPQTKKEIMQDAVIFSGQGYAEGGTVDSALSDYAQLLEAYPNAKKFLSSLGANLEQHIPTQDVLESPEKLAEWSQAAALNAPMGLVFGGTKKAPVLMQSIEDYVGHHTAPTKEFGAPLHDVTGGGDFYPEDFYSNMGYHYYGEGRGAQDKNLFAKIKALRGKPEQEVEIYRAVPNDPNITSINHGDWITIDPQYAKEHGQGPLGNDYKILKAKVPAKSIYTNADSPYEYGLDLSVLEKPDNKNLNAGLIQKYLKEGALSPEEMTQYEANALAMETPNLQKYNLENANAQGGTPESRARDLRFDIDAYHGTTYPDIKQFLPDSGDKSLKTLNWYKDKKNKNDPVGYMNFRSGSFFSPKPEYAESYTSENKGLMYPVKIKTENPLQLFTENGKYKAINNFNNSKTMDSLILNNSLDKNDINEIAVIDPAQIRSRFAAFDPLRKASPSLLASGALGSLLLKEELNKEKPVRKAEGGSVESALSDYSQLLDAYPNARKFLSSLGSNIEQHIPTQDVLQSPEKLAEWSQAAALNAPMGLIFAGQKAANAPIEKFAQANQLAKESGLLDEKVGSTPWMQKNKDIWGQTGIHYGYDMKPRFEISDTPFKLNTQEDFQNIIDQANANMQAMTEEAKAIRQAKKEPNPQVDLFEKELAKSRNERLKDIKSQIKTTTQDLNKEYGVDWGAKGARTNLDVGIQHPELLQAYPQIGEDIRMGYFPERGPGGRFYNNWLDIYGTPETEASRSTGIHELQHAIQRLEGMNFGGSPESAPYIYHEVARRALEDVPVKTRMNAIDAEGIMYDLSPLRKVSYIHDLENISRPRDLFNTQTYLINSDKLRDIIGSPPRYGSKLPWAQEAGRVLARMELENLPYDAARLYNSGVSREEIKRQINNLNAQLNRRWDDWRTYSQLARNVRETNPSLKNFSEDEAFDMYQRLAGEAEARAVEKRLNYTPEERASIFPLEDYDVKNPLVHNFEKIRAPSPFAEGGSVSTDSTDSALSDYAQLLEAYPNAKKFLASLGANIKRNIPTQAELENPEVMQERAIGYLSPMAGAIKVSHGSPHLFDKFDMSKIGTGEGAQSYGHGLYFAESPETAKTYATMRQQEWRDKIPLKQYHAMSARARGDLKREAELLQEVEELKANMPGFIYNTSLEWPDAAREAVDPMGPHHFLDWDKPLSEQSDEIKSLLDKYASDNAKNELKTRYEVNKNKYGLEVYDKKNDTYLKNIDDLKDEADFENWLKNKNKNQFFNVNGIGRDLYNKIVEQAPVHGVHGSKEDFDHAYSWAAKHLTELGIPGIRYLDQGSRDLGEGTSNYVVFDDKIPNIVEINGKPIKKAEGGRIDKDSLPLNKPRRTPNHPTKSHVVKTMVDGKEKIIRFGEQGAVTAGKPKEGESEAMKAKRASFKARHAKNIAKGPSSAAYWADKVKWADGGSVDIDHDHINSIIEAFNSEYGLRPDNTEKGRGYLNELKRPDGAVMTEFSIGVPIEGREMDIPTLVPTLTIDEIKSILSLPESGKIPRSIVKKAAEHAINRVKQGKSVFATPEESEFGER